MNANTQKRNAALLICTACSLLGCNTTDENSVDAVRIPPSEAYKILQEKPDRYLLIDARPLSAFEVDRIPGAEQLDPSKFDPQDPDPRFEQYKAVIIYGADPTFGRANALTKRFLEAGIDVRMLDGGLKAWRTQGFPVENGSSMPKLPSEQP